VALVELDHRRACSAAEVDVNRRWLGILMSINVLGGCGAAASAPPAPSAAGCGAAFSVGVGKGIDTPARMVTWCRSQFVATRLAVAP
jgi:hypothetical protein